MQFGEIKYNSKDFGKSLSNGENGKYLIIVIFKKIKDCQ
jgi:hypothetical protein